MKRIIDYYLLEWKNRQQRKPLLLRGARQVGKTHAVRVLGKTFDNFIEINLEVNAAARTILEKDLDINRIILQLSQLLQRSIQSKTTLLFFDEIQAVPKAILLLRYFYELFPDLHVIAAGSLLDFAIEQVGIPVGRVSTLYMYPVSFIEFLIALGYEQWASTILQQSTKGALSDPLHEKLLNLVGQYIAIGGMPEAINEWIRTKQSRDVRTVHTDLVYAYQQDFGIYARAHQMKHLNILFLKAIEQLGNKFVYSRVGEFQKRELSPALELLEKAGLFYRVIRSAGQGVPIGAQADMDYFKIIFLDVGLSQALLQFDITFWFLDPLKMFVNKGEIIEAFVGQELLAYADPIHKGVLFYWQRENRGSEAEVDYLIQLRDLVVPIEVKSGTSKRIKSMHIFLDSHPHSLYGVRFWTNNYDQDERLYSYPLYAIIKPLADENEHTRRALESLLK